MAYGNFAAVYVHDIRIPTHVFVDCDRLRRERFVRFDEVEICNLPASFFESLARSRNWPGTHDFWVHADRCPRDNPRKWLNASARGLCLAHDHKRSRTVIEA